MDKKKLVLFPMTRDLCTVVRFKHLLGAKGYTLLAAMVPSFMGLVGLDASKLDGGNPIGFPLSGYADSLVEDCDAIYLDYSPNLPAPSAYQLVMDVAKKLGKDILLSRQLSVKLGLIPEYLPMSNQPIPITLQECPVPVVSVLTQGHNTNQFAFELALNEYFTTKGYQVAHISPHNIGPLFGLAPYPDCLYENREAYEKTLLLNQYIKETVTTTQPDLLIIGIPGAIMKYNSQNLLGLGTLPYAVGNAIRSDVSVYCAHYAKNVKEYLQMVTNYCNYRLNSVPEIFDLANVTVSVDDNTTELDYVTLPIRHVTQSLAEEEGLEKAYVLTGLAEGTLEKACAAVEDLLAGHVRYVL